MRFAPIVTPLLLLALLVPAHASAQAAIEGTWLVELSSPEGVNQIPMRISQDGTALTAELAIELPPGQPGFSMSGTLEGSSVTWSTEIDYQGMALAINMVGEIEGESMSGIADFGGLAEGPWSAERTED